MPTNQFIIYARKSSESEERQILSIDAQIAELKSLAARRGFVVSEILRESQSAKSPGRPVFSQLVSRITRGEVLGILCWKLDRLARNPVDGGSIIWALKQHGLCIHTPTQSYSTAEDNTIMMYIEFGMAQKYIDDLSQNVKRGNRAKLERGEWPGLAPQGYLNDLSTHTIVPDPDRFSLVRRMWDMALTGTYTVPQIVEVANEEWGYRTRKTKRMGGTKLQMSSLYRILSNPFYYGLIERETDGAVQIHAGAHQPMVTEAEFKRMQQIMGRDIGQRSQKHSFPFIGLMACGECGASITAEEHKKKSGRRYVYYRCTRKLAPCREPFVSANELERQIKSLLGEIRASDQFCTWALEQAKTAHDQETGARTQMYQNQHLAYAKVQRQLDGLVNMHLRELLSEEEYLRKRQVLQRELASLKLKLADTDDRAAKWLELTERVFIFANLAQKNFNNGTEQEKREIFAALGSNFTLKDRMVSVKLSTPFEMLKSANENVEISSPYLAGAEGLPHTVGKLETLLIFGRPEATKFELLVEKVGDFFRQEGNHTLYIPHLNSRSC